MCATCDFELPNGIHLCPPCATRPQSTLGPKRKRAMIWSYVCAGGATLGFIISMIIATHGVKTYADQQAIGVMMMLIVMVPGVTGLGLGFGAIDRRLSNPGILWAATIWNGVIVAGLLLLSIIGTLR